MRVLVTAATGCSGGAVARRLAGDGATTTATGRNPIAGALLTQAGAHFEPAELTDDRRIDALVNGQEVVIHCGGFPRRGGRPSAFEAANVCGTRNVVAACQRHSVSA